MANIYKLIVTVLMTSSVTFGYRRMVGFRRHMKGRRMRSDEFGNMDQAYDFFSRAIVKKPFLSEIHVMPPVFVVERPFPSRFPSKILRQRNNQGTKRKTAIKSNKAEKLPVLKRPLVQLLHRRDSEIGKAIDKFLKAADTKEKAKVNRVPKKSLTVATATLIADNKAPPTESPFPVSVSETLDIQTLGPGPYSNCYPPAMVVCGARLPWAHVQGMAEWCEQNCDKEAYTKHCDDIRCTCKCLEPGEPF